MTDWPWLLTACLVALMAGLLGCAERPLPPGCSPALEYDTQGEPPALRAEALAKVLRDAATGPCRVRVRGSLATYWCPQIGQPEGLDCR